VSLVDDIAITVASVRVAPEVRARNGPLRLVAIRSTFCRQCTSVSPPIRARNTRHRRPPRPPDASRLDWKRSRTHRPPHPRFALSPHPACC